jgi:hypothetical protein
MQIMGDERTNVRRIAVLLIEIIDRDYYQSSMEQHPDQLAPCLKEAYNRRSASVISAFWGDRFSFGAYAATASSFPSSSGIIGMLFTDISG